MKARSDVWPAVGMMIGGGKLSDDPGYAGGQMFTKYNSPNWSDDPFGELRFRTWVR